jgi:hypothetical protein
VLEEVRLNIATGGDRRDIGQWSAEITGPRVHQASSRDDADKKEWTLESGIPGRLILRTAQPPSTWVFEPVRECLPVSSTAPGAVLTGRAPVPNGRAVARLLDKDGVPVTWQGTGECAETYGGGFTRNTLFLPRENPDCMYFALGHPRLQHAGLDSSHPGAMGFLKDLFGKLGEWGFEYYKFDGEFAVAEYAPKVDRTRLHDRTTDPLEIYRRRLALIREAVGPGTFIEGCPAGTPLDGIGHFNSYFNGQGVYNNWQGMHSLVDSINANGPVQPGLRCGLGVFPQRARRRLHPPLFAVGEVKPGHCSPLENPCRPHRLPFGTGGHPATRSGGGAGKNWW